MDVRSSGRDNGRWGCESADSEESGDGEELHFEGVGFEDGFWLSWLRGLKGV